MFKPITQAFFHSDRLSTACLLVLVTLILSASHGFLRLDYLLFDVGQKLFARAAPHDVVIVAVDEYSLSTLGRWPWSRAYHAELIQRLHADGAKVIGLDFVLSEPEVSDLDADKKLSQAIKLASNVVLPVLLEGSRVNGQLIETLPLPMFAEYAAGLGRVHVVLDDDGLARGIYLWEGLGDAAWPHFTHEILNVAGLLPSQYVTQAPKALAQYETQSYALQRSNYVKVNFLGSPGHFQHVSYAQVLAGDYSQHTFKDKIVLVGATAVGMGDALPMPMTGLKQAMSGVEFHANTLQAMRSNRLISIMPLWLVCIINVSICVLPLIYLPKTTATRGLLMTIVLFLMCLLLAISNPSFTNSWIPLSAALTGLLIAYPIWSWRKLETATHFLDHELALLQQDLTMLGMQNKQQQHQSQDLFESRILKVQHASNSLRDLHQQKSEMLAFISHDIRAPLATLLLKLEQSDFSPAEMKQPLARSIKLLEQFLQTSRAEMLSPEKYQEIYVPELLHQVVDDAYAIAQQKNITIVREFDEIDITVNGEFGLLHRSVLNLLLNAIKFSSIESRVIVRLSFHQQQALISVIDFGSGIEATLLPTLFNRFKKAEGAQTNQTGAGLGLYFVKTVVEKHRGHVWVESTPYFQTQFNIALPALQATIKTPS